MNRHLVEVLLILGLIVLNGFFAAAEIALVSARRAALKAAADKGSPGAREALRLMEDPSRFLAAIQVGITLAGFLASATAAVSLALLLERWLAGFEIPWLASAAPALSVFLVTLLVSYLTLVLGELAPKRLGLQRAEAVAQRVARAVGLFARVTGPVTWVLSHSANVVARAMGMHPGGKRPDVTEEEIRLLVAEQMDLLDEEKRMIDEVFELGDTTAKEIMVPRVDMAMLPGVVDVSGALAVFRSSGFSRLPVYEEEPDKVVGIVLLKDLLPAVVAGESARPVTDLMREPVFVPETKPVLPLMNEMQATRNHLVVVVDEYGGTAGLVTLEDIVEEVIGEIVDEYDKEERYVTRLDEGDWVVDGRISIEEVREALGLSLPDSEEYETLAGWVLVELGHIPVSGESVEFDDARISVQTVRRRRISRIRVTRIRAS